VYQGDGSEEVEVANGEIDDGFEASAKRRADADTALDSWTKRIRDTRGANLPTKADIDALIKAGIHPDRVAKNLRAARNAAKSLKETDERKAHGLPLSMVQPPPSGGAVPAWDLKRPAAHWTVVMDETGESFDDGDRGAPGKFAAILVPDGCELPVFENFHASESTPTDVDAVMQALLDKPVGVFGLTVAASNAKKFQRDVWIFGVLEVVHWALRLIPIGDETTRVSFLIEQKGRDHKAQGNLVAAQAEIRRSLADNHPLRAKRLMVEEFRFIDKREPLLAYVDAVAHTFAGRREDAKVRLRRSGLEVALLNDASVSTRDFDRVMAADDVGGAVWRKLVRQGQGLHPIGKSLLERLSARCRKDTEVWRSLLGETRVALDQANRNLNLVGREVRWLAACRPVGEALEPALELVWATAELAEANHRGEVLLDSVRRIRLLGDQLIDEEVRLVAEAELHAAVTLTNLFDFKAAAAIIARWGGDHRRELGRRLFGRVLSTRGQHHAFLGRNAEAVRLFTLAIAEFEGMLSVADSKRDLEQTRSYRGFALMDLKVESGLDADEEAARRADYEYLTGAVKTLSRVGDIRFELEGDGPTPYQWHFYLRHLAILRNERSEGDISRLPAPCDDDLWQWPWPMVQAYCASRYWLHGQHDNARERLRHATQLARSSTQGPTVRAIALALEMAAKPWGIEADEAARKAVQAELPNAMARFRGVTITDDFVENLRRLLPFNFR